MNLTEFLQRRAERGHAEAMAFTGLSNMGAVQRGDAATGNLAGPDQLKVDPDPKKRGQKGGVFDVTATLDQVNVAIEYRDAAGNFTRRSITIQEISSRDGFPVLNAFCHISQAMRTFRVDRIEAIITKDGEIIAPEVYFLDAFGIDLRVFAKVDPTASDDPFHQAQKVRDAIRPMLSLLVLAARSDREFHREELEVILLYAEHELITMERLGSVPAPINVPMLDQLKKVVRDLRPNAASVEYYIERVNGLNEARQKKFWKAMRAVIFADGEISKEESEFEALLEELRYK